MLWSAVPGVRPRERPRALFFIALLLLISAGQTLGLAGSEALLLAELGAAGLPLLFIAAAAATVLASFGYATRVDSARNAKRRRSSRSWTVAVPSGPRGACWKATGAPTTAASGSATASPGRPAPMP